MKESSITAKGQTTIPRAVREALGVTAGDKVRYIVEGKTVRIRKVRSIMELAGALYEPDTPPVSIEEMDDAIAAGAAEIE